MILIDYSQLSISAIMAYTNHNPKEKLDEGLIRHLILNSIRTSNKQFGTKYGKLVICCDNKEYWRKDVFPFYKSHRKKDRDKSAFDWKMIFDNLSKIKEELKRSFPYKVIEIEKAEGDDIIAILSARFSPQEDVLILSSDKDFLQLQKYKNVQQYSPILKRFIRTENPSGSVKEHILRGDKGDGIPNFLSADNTFAIGERQKTLNTKKLLEWINQDPSVFCVTDTMTRGYKRNQMLVDFDHIPDFISSKIVETFESTKTNAKSVMLNYFIEKRLTNLLEFAGDF
jgi:hypothetical protein